MQQGDMGPAGVSALVHGLSLPPLPPAGTYATTSSKWNCLVPSMASFSQQAILPTIYRLKRENVVKMALFCVHNVHANVCLDLILGCPFFGIFSLWDLPLGFPKGSYLRENS